MKTIYDALDDYCESTENTNIDSILKEYHNYFDHTPSRLKEELKRKQKPRNHKKYVAIFNAILGVPLEYFELDQKLELKTMLENRFDGDFQVFQLGGFSGSNTLLNEFLGREYYVKSKEFLKRINHRLMVYDYLGRFENETKDEKIPYVSVHSEIFDAIESQLGLDSETQIRNKVSETDVNKLNPKINYVRFFALKENHQKQRVRLTDEALVSKIIDGMSLPLFKHVYNCLKNFQEFGVSEDFNLNHGFYLLNYTPFRYHFAYTDDGSYCLTEKYRYSRSGACNLDLLFIEQGKGEFQKLSKVYKEVFNNLFENENPIKLTLEKINENFKGDIDAYKEIYHMNKTFKPNIHEQKIKIIMNDMWNSAN